MAEKYDMVVGIPSYKEADSIGHVTQMADMGLERYFPDRKCVIVNCDNDSPDNTKEAFLSVETKNPKKYISTARGVLGKGNNFFNLFTFFLQCDAQTGIVVDADLKSITPAWIKHLSAPVSADHDLATPVYSRHQFDGTITNHLCYPLIFGLTGRNIRQPIGGDFAFSRKLCEHWMKQDWSDPIRQYGIDVFMTLNAIFGGFSIAQAGLGGKIHKASAPKLGQMFQEVAHALFSLFCEHRKSWFESTFDQGVPHSWPADHVEELPFFGISRLSPPQELTIDVLKMKRDCRDEYEKNRKYVKKYLSPYAYERIETMFEMDYYNMEIMLWSQIVFTLLCCYVGANKRQKNEIINALRPLYFSRALAFDYQTWRYSVVYAEEEVENQALAFMSQRSYFYGLYLRRNHPAVVGGNAGNQKKAKAKTKAAGKKA